MRIFPSNSPQRAPQLSLRQPQSHPRDSKSTKKDFLPRGDVTHQQIHRLIPLNTYLIPSWVDSSNTRGHLLQAYIRQPKVYLSQNRIISGKCYLIKITSGNTQQVSPPYHLSNTMSPQDYLRQHQNSLLSIISGKTQVFSPESPSSTYFKLHLPKTTSSNTKIIFSPGSLQSERYYPKITSGNSNIIFSSRSSQSNGVSPKNTSGNRKYLLHNISSDRTDIIPPGSPQVRKRLPPSPLRVTSGQTKVIKPRDFSGNTRELDQFPACSS